MFDLQFLLNPVLDHAAFRGALQALAADASSARPPATLSGLTNSAKALVVAGLSHRLQRPLIVLTSDNETAANLQRTTSTFRAWLEPLSDPAVLTLPALDCSPYEGRSPHAEVLEQRAVTLWRVARGRARALYVPASAALGRFRERVFYASLALEFKVGDELDLDDLIAHLSAVEDEPAEPVSDVGQFSMRGGMVDVFPPEVEWPFRLEFFGDRIESLREFDPATQRSRKPVPTALLLPLAEVNRSRQVFEKLVRALVRKAYPQAPAKTRDDPRGEPEPEWAAEYSNPFPGWEFFVPLVEPHPNSLFTLFDNPILLWDEPSDRSAQLKQFLEGLAAGYDEVRDVIPPRPKPEDIFFSDQEFVQTIQAIPQLSLKELPFTTTAPDVAEGSSLNPAPLTTEQPEDTHETAAARDEESPIRPESTSPITQSGACNPPPESQSSISEAGEQCLPPPSHEWVLLTQPSPKFQAGVKGLVENLHGSFEQGMTVIFVVPSSGKAERLRGILTEYEIPFATAASQQGASAES